MADTAREFKPLPRGAYLLEIHDLDPEYTSHAGNTMLKVTFAVQSPDKTLQGRRLWVYLHDQNRTFTIGKTFEAALGFWPGDESDPQSLRAVGKQLRAMVDVDESGSNKISRFLGGKAKAAPPREAGAAGDATSGADTDEEVPF